MTTFEAKQVFTKKITFHGNTPTNSHALCHSCRPFPLFLVQVMVFCKTNCASLIEIEGKPTHTLESICCILTTIWRCITHTRTYKRYQQSQNFTTHNKCSSRSHGGKIVPFIFDICKNNNIKPVFCKHIIHVHCHGISGSVCSFKKIDSHMTRLPLVIQEMNNKNKCINTSLWHLNIKRYDACITWSNGWRNKPYLCPFNNHR